MDKSSIPKGLSSSFAQFPKIEAFITQRQNLCVFLLIIFLGIIAYFKSFCGGFQFDDYFAIVDNPVVKRLDWPLLWGYNKVRFLTNLTFVFNYLLGGLNVFGWHVVNNFIHFVNSFLIYLLTRITFQTTCLKEKLDSKAQNLISIFTSLIFLVHPLQTQAVTYIVQRATTLSGCFYLSTLYFYVKGRIENQKKYYLRAVMFAFLSMLTKPTMITLPLAAILYDYFFLNSIAGIKRKNVFFILLITLPIIIIPFFLLGPSTLIDVSIDAHAQISPVKYLLTQFNVIVTYIRLLFFPVNQNIDYDFPIAQTIFEFPTILSLLAIFCLWIAALKLFQRHRIISFGILWFFLSLGPQSSIFSLTDVIVEHRTYLPSYGLIFAVCYGLHKLIKNKKTYVYFLSALVIVLTACTYERNNLWSRPIDFMKDTVKKSPSKARTHNNLGFLYYKQGEFEKAQSEFQKAVELDPQYFISKQNLAMMYYEKGQIQEAQKIFLDLIKNHPLFVDSYVGLALVDTRLQKSDEAILLFNQAIKLNPYHAAAFIGLGNIYQERGQWSEAKKNFQAAVKFDPDMVSAHYNLGNANFKLGYFYEALLSYIEAVRLNPNFSLAYNNMGNIYFYFSDYPKALEQYLKAVQSDPVLANAYFNLANTFYELGDMDQSRRAIDMALELYRKQNRRDMVEKIEKKLKEKIKHVK